MIDKNTLIDLTQKLIDSAKHRNTQQGLKTYEAMIQRVRSTTNEQELAELLELYKHNLAGIEAHGNFTQDEFELVEQIRRII
jgi:uncharacterized protein YxjI